MLICIEIATVRRPLWSLSQSMTHPKCPLLAGAMRPEFSPTGKGSGSPLSETQTVSFEVRKTKPAHRGCMNLCFRTEASFVDEGGFPL